MIAPILVVATMAEIAIAATHRPAAKLWAASRLGTQDEGCRNLVDATECGLILFHVERAGIPRQPEPPSSALEDSDKGQSEAGLDIPLQPI